MWLDIFFLNIVFFYQAFEEFFIFVVISNIIKLKHILMVHRPLNSYKVSIFYFAVNVSNKLSKNP